MLCVNCTNRHLLFTLSLQLHCVSVVVSHSPATQTVMCGKDSSVNPRYHYGAHVTVINISRECVRVREKGEHVLYNNYVVS